MKNIVSSTIFLATVATLLCSCNGKLSSSKAKELIIAQEKLPKPLTDMLKGYYFACPNCRNNGYGEDPDPCNAEGYNVLYQSLLDNGLITAIECNSTPAGNRKISLTEKGKKYEVEKTTDYEIINQKNYYKIKLADVVFDEITGVVEDEANKKAHVVYTTKSENITLFGESYKLKYSKILEPCNHTVNFEKYDDGWRIVGQ